LIAAPAGTDAGIAELITIFVTKDETVIVDDADLLWSVVESAVTATVFFDGTLKGAVYVVVPPLAVCAGEKVPQLGALPQSATQSTPAFATSLLTVADTWAEPPTTKARGGACVMVTEMIGVVDAELDFAGLLEHPANPQKPATLSHESRNVAR
jgi:hypothetical protein